MAYAETIYLDMMSLSLLLWRNLHTYSQDPVLVETGCLALARCVKNGELSPSLKALVKSYEDRGLAYAVLHSVQISERFPQFDVPADVHGVYVEEAGVLFAERCVTAALARAKSLGVNMRTPFRAASLKLPDGADGLLSLHGEDGSTVHARRCVLSPGALLHPFADQLLGIRIPTAASEETVSYFAPRDGDIQTYSTNSGVPTFLLFHDEDDAANKSDIPCEVYGIPSVVVPGVKVAGHFCGPWLGDRDADLRAAEACEAWSTKNTSGNRTKEESSAWAYRPDRAEKIERLIAAATTFLRDFFPGLQTQPFKSVQCLYTRMSDSHFVLDIVPDTNGRVVIAGGGSGHPFKMAPAMGECAVELAFGRRPPIDLMELKLERLVLQAGTEEESWKKRATFR